MPEIMTVMSQITEGLTADNYCLCLFVDGLDEFGGDTVDRLELARLLNQWAKHPNVKILCSARPYPEFLDTFQKSASTIYLHELTKGDISLYSLSTLRQEQKRRLGSESPWTNQHQALIRRIVDRSEGVFIWSRAVVRFLSSKIGHLGPESLASLLEETPQSLYDLYHQMLARRDPMAKRRGNKMLLLAIRYLPEKQLDALAYSWFDKLEDRNFPMNCEPTCYSQTEVEQRIGIVREWLSDGTAGLLEVSCSPIYRMSYHSFFVQPLHRTVLDFLVNDWSTTETLSVDPQFLQEDIYWRIALAGLKVCVGMISWHDEEQFIPLCSYLPRTGGLENNDKVPTNELVRFMKEFEAITSHHQDLLDLHYQDLPNSKKPRALSSMLGRFSPETYPMEVLHVPAVNVPASLIHEALFYDHQRYVLHEIATRPRLVAEDGARVNLLFISCLRSDVRFTEKLISAGARYSCTMPVQQLGTSPKSSTYFTVWVVLLRFLSILSQEVMSESSQIWPETMDSGLPPSAFLGSEVYMKVSMILEETLQTQDSDWDAIVLVKEKYIDPSESKPRLTIPEATYIDLESLLEIALCRMAIGPKSFDVDDFTNNLLQEFQERVVSFQAWRARKRSPQQMWHKSLREKVAEYLWSPPTQVPNQVAVAKNTYPRADLEKLRNGQFRVYGIVTKTERFVGGFEIALF
jgi:hypothetical protein